MTNDFLCFLFARVIDGYIILGHPGAGKGMCGQYLQIKKGYKHLSFGDLLRKQVRKKTEIGLKYENEILTEKLIPDSVAVEVIANQLNPNKKICTRWISQNHRATCFF